VGKPFSTNLCSRQIAAVANGMSRRSAAERLGVATAVRLVEAVNMTGAMQATTPGDTPSQLIEAISSVILAALAAQLGPSTVPAP
jgi:transposase